MLRISTNTAGHTRPSEDRHTGAPAHSTWCRRLRPPTPPYQQTKIEWWSEVVAGQGLQEVQAQPSHTEKVTVDSEFPDKNVFILEKTDGNSVQVYTFSS